MSNTIDPLRSPDGEPIGTVSGTDVAKTDFPPQGVSRKVHVVLMSDLKNLPNDMAAAEAQRRVTRFEDFLREEGNVRIAKVERKLEERAAEAVDAKMPKPFLRGYEVATILNPELIGILERKFGFNQGTSRKAQGDYTFIDEIVDGGEVVEKWRVKAEIFETNRADLLISKYTYEEDLLAKRDEGVPYEEDGYTVWAFRPK